MNLEIDDIATDRPPLQPVHGTILMPGMFLTKKQKIKMRERRKKKLRAEKENGIEPIIGNKRKRADEGDEKDVDEKPNEPLTIVVPANLSAKAARKFRKESRRKARRDGVEDSMLTFLVEGQQEEERPKKKAKPAKSFPSIIELLKKKEEEKLKQAEQEARKQAEDALPESYKSKYLALDCEMVGIGSEGKQSALARVSLVDWYDKPVLDTFVQVPSRVTDFRTHVSGVTAKHISHKSAMEVKECRAKVASLLKGKVLVGHALHNDFQALLLQHPKEDIRDTAKYRPFQRVVGSKWRPRKLRDLVKENCGLDIQVVGESHDSVEDASATLSLFKLVREEWEKELEAKRKKKKKK